MKASCPPGCGSGTIRRRLAFLTYATPERLQNQSWQFQAYARNAWLYLDEHAELSLNSLEQTVYQVQTTSAANLPIQSGGIYAAFKIYWTYPTASTQMTLEASGPWLGRRSYYSYATAQQGGAQFGNVTHRVKSEWDGAAFADKRLLLSQYYPNTSGVYLVGLPGYANQYACPAGLQNGACQSSASSASLVASHWYLYDGHYSWASMYSQPPSGILTAQRSFLQFVGANYTDPRYSDVLYGYDAWGNRTSVTTYTGGGSLASLASTGGGQPRGLRQPVLQLPAAEPGCGRQCQPSSYDYALGLPTQETAPNGAVTKGFYDAFGRLTSVQQYASATSYATTTFSYHIPTTPSLNNPFWTEANQTGEVG